MRPILFTILAPLISTIFLEAKLGVAFYINCPYCYWVVPFLFFFRISIIEVLHMLFVSRCESSRLLEHEFSKTSYISMPFFASKVV